MADYRRAGFLGAFVLTAFALGSASVFAAEPVWDFEARYDFNSQGEITSQTTSGSFTNGFDCPAEWVLVSSTVVPTLDSSHIETVRGDYEEKIISTKKQDLNVINEARYQCEDASLVTISPPSSGSGVDDRCGLFSWTLAPPWSHDFSCTANPGYGGSRIEYGECTLDYGTACTVKFTGVLHFKLVQDSTSRCINQFKGTLFVAGYPIHEANHYPEGGCGWPSGQNNGRWDTSVPNHNEHTFYIWVEGVASGLDKDDILASISAGDYYGWNYYVP